MTISAGLRRGILLAATGMMLTGGAVRAQEMDAPETSARARLPQGAIVQPIGDGGPGAELRRNLVTLANNPRSLDALIGAGRAANAMGDFEAALGFFARADEIDPVNPRAKAGIAATLVRMERAEQALTHFARAVSLGAPEAEIAADRGFAYDLMGDSARAQRDYQLALRHRADPEVERRLALSLAISGQRDQALRVLDAQLRRRDRAGWRAQAFVLALTGDARGAEDTAGRMMTGASAQAMVPFFQRLHMLTPAQKAAAVHFGRFPAHARSMQIASYAPPPAAAEPVRARPQPAEPLERSSRRRSRTDDAPVATLIRSPRNAETAPPVEPRSRPVQLAQAEPARPGPSQPAATEPPQPEPMPEAVPSGAPSEPAVQPVEVAASAPANPGFSFSSALPAVPEPQEPPAARPTDFGAVAELVQSLPAEPAPERPATREAQPSRAAARPVRTAQAEPARERARRNAPPPNPARHWVQIAGGANRASMPREFARLRDQAPALLRSRPAYVTPANATNRLLVGPFDNEREAQAFVNRLGQSDVRAFAWTSAAGQEIERLRTTDAPRSAGAGARPRQEQGRTTANDSRSSRNRSGQEQGAASRGRRSR